MSTRLILADDHAILRYALSKSFQQHEGINVVGQTRDGRSTVKLAKELLPDVVVMDIGMPDLNGMEATRQIVRDCPGVKVLALSMHSSNKYVREMFRAGAKGYVIKDCLFEELLHAIQTVVEGKVYVSPLVGETIVEDYTSKYDDKSAFNVLSKRERELLQLLAEGKTTKQAAALMQISPKTARAHRLRIMNKLVIDNVAQLTKYAVQEGLTVPEP